MAKFRDFSQENGDIEKAGGGSGLFLKLEKGTRNKVRLVGKPLQYFQHWEPIICRSPYKDDEGNILDPLMLQGYEPKVRFCIWIIDRTDQALKIMDFPTTLYNAFREWHKGTNEDPGGYNGPDWNILVEAPSGKQQYVKYTGTPLVQTPFTEDELKQIKEGNLKERMMKVRGDNTPEEIREMMAEKGVAAKSSSGESRVAKTNEVQSQAKKQTQAPETTTAPVQVQAKPHAQTSNITPDLEF
jgi:hypothetical protein